MENHASLGGRGTVCAKRCLRTWICCGVLLAALGAHPAGAQEQQKAFGGKYSELLPEQKTLVARWAAEYEKITGQKLVVEDAYDHLSLSSRSTFEAVTHALVHSNLTDPSGKSLGRAIDLVDVVERIAGRIPGTRGDHQFRVYVYLKKGALQKLDLSREFKRVHDNTVFHIGYPINFRQQGGTPSMQFSLARTGVRADIDVDYRSSFVLKAAFDGHLTAANSDVRAGNNHQKHNERWKDFSNWWESILAGLAEKDVNSESASGGDGEPAVPAVRPEWLVAAKGDIHEAVYGYFKEWLVNRAPENVLHSVSVRAYPCVAEFKDGSRPDSRLALVRILERMRSGNRRTGKITDLSQELEPVDYPLPDAKPINHPHSKLFRLQEVPDDVAWAMDCRIRFHLDMAVSLPQPSHKANGIYAATVRLKHAPRGEYIVLFWRKEVGEWKLVSFDFKHSLTPQPPDLVARASAHREPETPPNQANIDAVDGAATQLLARWFLERKPELAIDSFGPESYACDAGRPESSPALPGPGDRRRVLDFLTGIADGAPRGAKLEEILAVPEAGHYHMQIVAHANRGAFLLARVSDDLLKSYACATSSAKIPLSVGAGKPTYKRAGYLTAFRAAGGNDEDNAVVLLFWEKKDGRWQVVSYDLRSD